MTHCHARRTVITWLEVDQLCIYESVYYCFRSKSYTRYDWKSRKRGIGIRHQQTTSLQNFKDRFVALLPEIIDVSSGSVDSLLSRAIQTSRRLGYGDGQRLVDLFFWTHCLLSPVQLCLGGSPHSLTPFIPRVSAYLLSSPPFSSPLRIASSPLFLHWPTTSSLFILSLISFPTSNHPIREDYALPLWEPSRTLSWGQSHWIEHGIGVKGKHLYFFLPHRFLLYTS